MRLYLVRPQATAPSADLDDAALRPLTARGRARLEAQRRALGHLGVDGERLVHSPWLSALETADALAPLVQETQVCSALAAPPAPPLFEALAGERLLVVGHQPWLAELLAWLTVGEARAGGGFALTRGGLARLDGELRPGAMRLTALWPGKLLRRVAR